MVSSLSFATLHVCHLGHYLTHDLSDDEDIVFRLHDFLKKANLFFYNFKFCSPSTLTFLFRSFCLSLYGCALWRLDSKSITSIEVAFNKVLRWIWNLPFNSHTRIVHCTAHLFSIFNLISARCSSFLSSILFVMSRPIHFCICSDLAYTTPGFNRLFGNKFKKTYYPEDRYCADIIRNIHLCEINSSGLEHIVNVVSSLQYSIILHVCSLTVCTCTPIFKLVCIL